MKKLFSSLLVVLTTFVLMATLGFNVKADEKIIDLYPNDDINNLKGGYGNSNWVLDFAGYRYHTVSFMARFATNFEGIEDEEKEEFSGADLPHISANAMGGFIHNDSDRDIILSDGDRERLTGVINRVWATFDEEGKLVLFEDHINVYYIKEVTSQDYFRLATDDEIKEYNDAEEGEKPGDMRHTHIRMVLNEDNETYKIEPLGYLKWENADYVPANAEEGIEEKGTPSIIFDYNPNQIHLKKGWTTLHFSTWDRGKAKFNEFIASMPKLLSNQEEKMKLNYLNPAPYFVNLKEKDVNKGEEGINFVYKINEEPTISMLIDKVEARHVNEEQSIKGQHTKVDYVIKIYNDKKEEVESVKVVYDSEEKKYVAEKEELEHLDTSVFGARYYATFESTQPELENETSTVTGDTVVEEAIIDVGVLPIHFTGVENVFIDEGLPINLLEGINAYDNANDLNDITSSLTYTIKNRDTGSDHFNIWNAKAGSYDVTVHAEYDYVLPIDTDADIEIKLGDKTATILENRINIAGDPFGWAATPPPMALFTEFNETVRDNLLASDLKYNVQMALLDGSGKIVAYFNTVTNKMRTENGPEVTISGSNKDPHRSQFINSIEFGVGYKLIAGYAPADDVHKLLADAKLGDQIEGLGFATVVEAEVTYRLTVADITAPKVRVKQEVFTIYTDSSFKNAEEAALSNVEIMEEHGYSVTVPGANRIDITTTGEHNIRVIVIDDSGNETEVTFKMKVEEARVSETEKDELEQELKDTTDLLNEANDKIKELEDSLSKVEQKREGTSLTTVIIVALIATVISIGASAALVFIKK